ALLCEAPALSNIDSCTTAGLSPRGETGFRIEPSAVHTADATAQVHVSPDIATCDSCLAEVLDPSSRRFGYAFTTCASCGPRLTIMTGVPYDRQRTTMKAFPMCAECRREYDDPADRRFHAETIACPACGPRLALVRDGRATTSGSLEQLAEALIAGRIVAVKGLGGYHLACDANNAAAVVELRRRKHRDEKPFAVMFASLEAASAACEVDAVEAQVLVSHARPVVLLRRHAAIGGLAPVADVAPGCPDIGAMLPPTPLHHLLLRAMGRPLVMTSANQSDEPIAYDDADALTRLAGLADVLLTHDRAIRVRCDDGVSRVVRGRELPVRRSRGHAPRPIRLPVPSEMPLLAVGGHMKNTFALSRGAAAYVSHHIGDLEDLRAYEAFRRDIRLYEALFGISPGAVVHDLHPGYASTGYAVERAAEAGIQAIAVQHHHAHVASAMAEHGLVHPVIGVAFDGSGHGDDGTVWGGEFLVGDASAMHRAAHLRPVALPGGEQAVREPWRMALSHLIDAGLDPAPVSARVGAERVRLIERMIARQLNTPMTSSAGRLFDAVAAIAGVCDRVTFEGQAALRLEWLARQAEAGEDGEQGYGHEIDVVAGRLVIDTRPIISGVTQDARGGRPGSVVARRFHSALARVVDDVCARLRARTGIDAVILTGGVFLNGILAADCERRLAAAGFRVYCHRVVPPGDGGLSLGQLAVAAARSARACV
nr:carbamoyltransferase HypF [Acidobacteriota bacterium]